MNQPLPNLSNVVSKVKSQASANQRPRAGPPISDNIVVPQVIIQHADLEPSTPLIPEVIQEPFLEPFTRERETVLEFSSDKTGNNSDQILSDGLDLFEESSPSTSRSNNPEEADKFEEDCVSVSNISDIEPESSTLTLVSDPAPHPGERDHVDWCLPNLVNNPMFHGTSDSLPGENVSSRLAEKQNEEEKKEVKIVNVEDTISYSFSDQFLMEDLSDIELKDAPASQPHIDPSRFVSYPDDLRPSLRLPQRLTSRRSTVFLQSSLCCCQGSRERRDSGSDNTGLSWIFCCLRTK